MNDMLKSLRKAISDVMERMFFLLADPDGETSEEAGGEYSVFIGITGEPLYRITLAFDPGLAADMTANALGTVKVHDDTRVRKCLLEAVNIIAGNFLQCWKEGKNREITLPSCDKDEVFGSGTALEVRKLGIRFEERTVSVVIETIPEHS